MLRVCLRISFVLGLCACLIFTGFVVWFFTGIGLPRLEEIKAKQLVLTSKVYANDGTTLLTELHGEQNREYVVIDDIGDNLRNAVIAIEDKRFYNHSGIDWVRIIKAFWTNVVKNEVVQGGSTITQQYVKNVLLGRERTYWRKIEEASLANQIEKKYSKDKILEFYMNDVYFGEGCYGVKTACVNFFGKQPDEVSISEAALLAGVIRSPYYYSPYMFPNEATARRNLVIDKMHENHFITDSEASSAKLEPLSVLPVDNMKPASTAPYFVEYVRQTLITMFGEDMVYRGGLRVTTTLDLNMQSLAEEAVFGTLDRPGDPDASIVALDPKNGEIKALVGGRDFDKQKYNIAVQGGRQPGSAFKVFVLASALESGIPVNKTYSGTSPQTIVYADGTKWNVRNCEGGSYGNIGLIDATVRSVNVVYAQLIKDVGPSRVVEYAKRMGITSHLDANPSIALGALTNGVHPLEMASAYGTLANNGMHIKPTCILRVTDSEGNLIWEHSPHPERVLTEYTANTINSVLSKAVKNGTGTRAIIDRPQAGKTGTTDNFADAWFVGYTPDLVAAVWVGYIDGLIPMRNVHGQTVYGGTFPALIWRNFMRPALAHIPPSDFIAADLPTTTTDEDRMVSVSICLDSGQLATPNCPHAEVREMRRSDAPTTYCSIHQQQPQDQVAVPNVAGMTESQAKNLIAGAGLSPSVSYQNSSSVPKGQVISQSPGAGSQAQRGSSVAISVSSGPQSTGVVPGVIGLGEADATGKISSAGFSPRVVTSPSDATHDGIVISQYPSGGSALEPGGTVIITVGRHVVPQDYNNEQTSVFNIRNVYLEAHHAVIARTKFYL